MNPPIPDRLGRRHSDSPQRKSGRSSQDIGSSSAYPRAHDTSTSRRHYPSGSHPSDYGYSAAYVHRKSRSAASAVESPRPPLHPEREVESERKSLSRAQLERRRRQQRAAAAEAQLQQQSSSKGTIPSSSSSSSRSKGSSGKRKQALPKKSRSLASIVDDEDTPRMSWQEAAQQYLEKFGAQGSTQPIREPTGRDQKASCSLPPHGLVGYNGGATPPSSESGSSSSKSGKDKSGPMSQSKSSSVTSSNYTKRRPVSLGTRLGGTKPKTPKGSQFSSVSHHNGGWDRPIYL